MFLLLLLVLIFLMLLVLPYYKSKNMNLSLIVGNTWINYPQIAFSTGASLQLLCPVEKIKPVEMKSGENYGYIYLTKNLINGDSYIGKHKGIKLDENYYGSGIWIQNAIKKHGRENFVNGIIEYCYSPEELDRRESYWVSFYDTFNNGYNLTIGGSDALVSSKSIVKQKKTWAEKPIEEKLERGRKISKALKGRKQNPADTKRRRDSRENIPREVKLIRNKKIGDTLLNRSEEAKEYSLELGRITRAAWSEKFVKDRNKANSDRQQNFSQEKKDKIAEKISIALTGRTQSLKSEQKRKKTRDNRSEEANREISKKLSDSLTGLIKSPIHRKRLSLANKGRIYNRVLCSCNRNISINCIEKHIKCCIKNPNKEKHICKICGYIGSRKQDLNTHMKRNHERN